jgi:hypothetical protein
MDVATKSDLLKFTVGLIPYMDPTDSATVLNILAALGKHPPLR